MKAKILLVVCMGFLASCDQKVSKEEARKIGKSGCSILPPYVSKTQIQTKYAALSTSVKKMPGLVLVDMQTGGTYQHESWKIAGDLGPMTTDENGNTWVAPVPVINVLNNEGNRQQHIYKVDGQTGIMQKFAELPLTPSSPDKNPYGILGLHYDCHGKFLLASSVWGSDDKQEKGVVYIMDIESGKIIDQLEGLDIMGLTVSGMSGSKRIFMGHARSSDVYSIEMAKNGKFIGKPQLEFSLSMLGPKGDDRAKKLSVREDGTILVKGVTFRYNLTAPTEIHENAYIFSYDRGKKAWLPVETVYQK